MHCGLIVHNLNVTLNVTNALQSSNHAVDYPSPKVKVTGSIPVEGYLNQGLQR